MSIGEIVFIILIVGFVCYVFSNEIYKRVKHKPTGECACCAIKSKRVLKKIKKDLKKDI